MKKVFGLLLVLVAALLAGGAAFADDPITEVEVTKQGDLGLDFNIQMRTNNGVRTETIFFDEGHVIQYKRQLSTTWAYSQMDTSTDGVFSLTASAADVQDPGSPNLRCCCTFECGGLWLHFDPYAGDCLTAGSDCELCNYNCNCGYQNCPRGTFPKIFPID